MIAILQQLHEEDHFGIILFSGSNVFWKDRPVKATKENLSEALEYIRRITDDGGSKDDSGFVVNAVCVVHSLAASSVWVRFFPSKEPTSTMQSWQQYRYWSTRGSRETSRREART